MKLQAAIDLFLNSYPNPGTRRSYSQCIATLLELIPATTPLADITSVHIIQVGQHIEAQRWKPATKRKAIKGIKTFFNWLVKYDIIEKSPARAIKTKRLPTYVTRDKAISDTELEELLSFVQFKPRDYALVLFLADTGCRAGGASGLRVQDIDFDHLTATVTEKGGKTRKVVFGEDTANAIRAWLLRRPTNAGEYVFSRDSKPVKPANLSQAFRRNCQRVGIRSLGSHSTRHRKGHQLADEKVAPTIAATALGHADPIVTLQNYYPADWESAEKALRGLVVETPKPKRFKISG